jgi:glycosyltransferase involved in cell wall biosynthesis
MLAILTNGAGTISDDERQFFDRSRQGRRPLERVVHHVRKPPMKVLCVAGFAPSLTNFRGPLLGEMVKRGHEVVALAPGEGVDLPGLAALGVGFEPIPLARTGLDPVADVGTLAALAGKLRAHQPDVFFAYTIKPVIYGGLVARFACPRARRFALITGLGYTFLDRTTPKRRLLFELVRGLYRAGLSGSEAVFFQNRDDLAELAGLGILPRSAKRVVVDGSGVDVEKFAPAPFPDGPPVLLYVGRLARQKGVLEVVDAARRLGGRVKIQLLGWREDGPDGIPETEVRGWEREGLVEYLGVTKDVRPHLARAYALLLPSYREGTPRSVLEAMAIGRPIVTSDAPGCRETVVDGENGFLVPVGDGAAVARAIEKLLADPALARRMGKRSREMVEARYDVRKVNAQMLDTMGL